MPDRVESLDRVDPATPTAERCVTSYPARRKYRPGVVHPPHVPGVKNVVDIHCHAHEGQQDPLSLAKFASENDMGGLLFKTVGPISSGDYRPALVVKAIVEELDRWSDTTGKKATGCYAGYGITMDNRPPSIDRLRQNIADGISAVWLPVFNHANTLHKVGGRRIWWDRNADPADHSAPLPWDEALRCGYYLLDDRGSLKPDIQEMLRVIVDSDIALFFGHATHPEIAALADFLGRFSYKRAVIDHPFSPFVDLSIEQMRHLTASGIYLNFTYDELSPLLGVDPARMYAAIREIGVERVTLSSDAGEPLFPNSVECMRLIRAYMAAFGLTEDELAIVCCRNPARIVERAN
jgi:hypothetical protein